MIHAIKKLLHLHWKTLTQEHGKPCYFYCITGNRWGPIIGEFAYFVDHASICGYHPCIIVDKKSSHWVTFSSLKVNYCFSSIDITEFIQDLDVCKSDKKLLTTNAENASLFLAASRSCSLHSGIRHPEFFYYPFASFLKALVHSTEYVHQEHALDVWNESIFNSRIFGTFFNQHNKTDADALFSSLKPRLADQEASSLLAGIQAAVDSFLPAQMLVISFRNVPFGWDTLRNTTFESVKEIIDRAQQHDVKCLFIVGQTPAPHIWECLREYWRGELLNITNPNYTSYCPTEKDIARIKTEIYVLSSVKYHCLACNGFVFIPYLFRSSIMIYDANTISPSGPEYILVPRHTAYLSSLLDKSVDDSSISSFLDHSRKQPPSGTAASALSNLLAIKTHKDFELLRERAKFIPELFLNERRNFLMSHEHFAGAPEEKSGYKDYTSRGVIQLTRNMTARSC